MLPPPGALVGLDLSIVRPVREREGEALPHREPVALPFLARARPQGVAWCLRAAGVNCMVTAFELGQRKGGGLCSRGKDESNSETDEESP